VAGILRGLLDSPVRVLTAAGALAVRCNDEVYLAGPAQVVARGEFYWMAAGAES